MVFRLILVGMVLIHNQNGVALVPRVAGHVPTALLLEGTCTPAADCIDSGAPSGITEMALRLNRDDISFGLPTVAGPVAGLPSLCELAARTAGKSPTLCPAGTGRPELHADCVTGNPSSCPIVARVRLPAIPTACHFSHEPLYTTPPAILTACSDLWEQSKASVKADVFEYGFQKLSDPTTPPAELAALPNAVILDVVVQGDSITLDRVPFSGGGTQLTLKPVVASDGTKVVTVAVMNEPAAATGGAAPTKHRHFKYFYTTLQGPGSSDPLVPMQTGKTAEAGVGKCEPYLVCLDSIFEERLALFQALELPPESAESATAASLLLVSPPHNAQECDIPTYP